MLFILMLEALSCQFRTGVSRELLYADDCAVMADSLEECIANLKVWKEGMELEGDTELLHKEDEAHGLGTWARPYS